MRNNKCMRFILRENKGVVWRIIIDWGLKYGVGVRIGFIWRRYSPVANYYERINTTSDWKFRIH